MDGVSLEGGQLFLVCHLGLCECLTPETVSGFFFFKHVVCIHTLDIEEEWQHLPHCCILHHPAVGFIPPSCLSSIFL